MPKQKGATKICVFRLHFSRHALVNGVDMYIAYRMIRSPWQPDPRSHDAKKKRSENRLARTQPEKTANMERVADDGLKPPM